MRQEVAVGSDATLICLWVHWASDWGFVLRQGDDLEDKSIKCATDGTRWGSRRRLFMLWGDAEASARLGCVQTHLRWAPFSETPGVPVYHSRCSSWHEGGCRLGSFLFLFSSVRFSQQKKTKFVRKQMFDIETLKLTSLHGCKTLCWYKDQILGCAVICEDVFKPRFLSRWAWASFIRRGMSRPAKRSTIKYKHATFSQNSSPRFSTTCLMWSLRESADRIMNVISNSTVLFYKTQMLYLVIFSAFLSVRTPVSGVGSTVFFRLSQSQSTQNKTEVTCSNVRQKPALVVWFLFFSLNIIKWLDVSEANVTGAVMSKRKSALSFVFSEDNKKSSGPYRVSTRLQDWKPKWEDKSDNNSKENMTVCQRTHKVIWEWGRGAHLFLIPKEWVWESGEWERYPKIPLRC